VLGRSPSLRARDVSCLAPTEMRRPRLPMQASGQQSANLVDDIPFFVRSVKFFEPP
jgi:hypothetical protein